MLCLSIGIEVEVSKFGILAGQGGTFGFVYSADFFLD